MGEVEVISLDDERSRRRPAEAEWAQLKEDAWRDVLSRMPAELPLRGLAELLDVSASVLLEGFANGDLVIRQSRRGEPRVQTAASQEFLLKCLGHKLPLPDGAKPTTVIVDDLLQGR